MVGRTSAPAVPLTIRGGAGVGDGDDAFAAVETVDRDRAGRFTNAEGVLFGAVTPDTQTTARSPLGDVACRDLPGVGEDCEQQVAGAVYVFMAWWNETPAFDRAFVVLRGEGKSIDFGEDGSRGWRLDRPGPCRRRRRRRVGQHRARPGRGDVRHRGVARRRARQSRRRASPLPSHGNASAGAGGATLTGGERAVTATCAQFGPPAAAAPGSTEWMLDGAVTGVSDTPARLVVVDAKAR